ncbi:MAG TPA: DUF881 domain-containing protein [Desulfosporosinus sp.]|nr:DUF881 domain-containing protein [Desulfosporosinus sp.]
MLLGFLFIILLKAQGIVGIEAALAEKTAMPSLMETEQENQLLSGENEKLQLEITKYAEGQSSTKLAIEQLRDAKMKAGTIEVSGPGLRITLDDSKREAVGEENPMLFLIHEQYIRGIFNALWIGGAEAIAINGQRVTTNTEVFCSGSYIKINGTRQMPPYVIDAIGDESDLSVALDLQLTWILLGDLQKQNGITRKPDALSTVVIPAGSLREYYFAEPVNEGT